METFVFVKNLQGLILKSRKKYFLTKKPKNSSKDDTLEEISQSFDIYD